MNYVDHIHNKQSHFENDNLIKVKHSRQNNSLTTLSEYFNAATFVFMIGSLRLRVSKKALACSKVVIEVD